MWWHDGSGKGVWRAQRRYYSMRVEESIEINRSLQEVFDYVSDVSNYPEWMADALEVRKHTAGPPQQSDRFTLAIKSVGRRFETPYERTSYEANRGFTDRAIGGPVPDQRWDSTFEEVPAGTRLTRAVEAEMSGILKLLEPIQKRSAGRGLRRDLQMLKDVLEAG
jgi:carbon monoxide dehydrogenase subunit G